MKKLFLLISAMATCYLTGCNNTDDHVGTYIHRENKSNTVILKSNGTYKLDEDGRVGTGSYTLKGDNLILNIEGQECHGKLVKDTMYDPDNEAWDKTK